MDLKRRDWLAAAGAATAAAGLATSATAADAASADDLKSIGKTPHTKFAVNVEMWFSNLPFLDRIRQTAALGFPAVEFWPTNNKDIPAVAALTKELGVAVAQFTAWGFAPGLNDPKNHSAFVKAVEDGCKIAKQLDCSLMTVVGGDDVPGLSQKEMHANIVKGLKLAAPIAEAANVTLILEPMNIRVDHKGHCLYGSEASVAICREVNSPRVKLNWDLYHMHITEGDLCRRLREGFDQVGYLQVADNPGRNEPGTGEIYYPRVMKEAWDLGYRGYVGLECRPREGELTAAKRVAQSDWR
ncbi:MAG: hydroxypyruvate isomerase family protein [Planctomycetia bacterium]